MSAVAALEGLEPALVWERFGELTRIARPSKEEDAAREHVLRWAEASGFESEVDGAGNLVVRVPASPGREGAPIVVLQAHLDMVCEREPGSPYDPREGRIRVLRDGDWVLAEGTTLGGDNGIGVAAAQAAAEDPGIGRGPLELLFTVSEEQGLEGAKALDPAIVRGRLLVNLDGTSDRGITIGCAGSTHTFVRVPLPPEPVPAGWAVLAVGLSGAKGGHSGGDIAAGRANAIKGLGGVLSRAYEAGPFRLALLEGGASRNAIPREARAVCALPPGGEGAFRVAANAAMAALQERFAATDDALRLTIEAAAAEHAAAEAATSRALDLLATLPTGVLALSTFAPGTVEVSTSLNVASTAEGAVTFASMTRSASGPALDEVVAGYEACARLAGAAIEVVRSYPPWTPDPGSGLLATAREAFTRLFDVEPRLEVVHGGLECAVLGARLPGVEMIAIGPEGVGAHAPGERLSIPGTERFYRLLGALLDDLSS
jgi:dipeptidase D